jgi:hypothetical protein
MVKGEDKGRGFVVPFRKKRGEPVFLSRIIPGVMSML